MPTDSKALGFSNKWYKSAMDHAEVKTLPNKKKIRVVTAPYFLATKLEAFDGRGRGDYMLSHDLEDLVSVIDGRKELVEEIRECDNELKKYLSKRFEELIDNPRFVESLPGKVPGDNASQARVTVILERMKVLAEMQIIDSGSKQDFKS